VGRLEDLEDIPGQVALDVLLLCRMIAVLLRFTNTAQLQIGPFSNGFGNRCLASS
jgi:hypothetical protein